MSESGSSVATKLQMHLSVLKRSDPQIEEVLVLTYGCAYEFSNKNRNWDRLECEGPLVVVRRSSAPQYQWIIQNKKAKDNLIESILPSKQLEFKSPYIYYNLGAKPPGQDTIVRSVWIKDGSGWEAVRSVMRSLGVPTEGPQLVPPTATAAAALPRHDSGNVVPPENNGAQHMQSLFKKLGLPSSAKSAAGGVHSPNPQPPPPQLGALPHHASADGLANALKRAHEQKHTSAIGRRGSTTLPSHTGSSHPQPDLIARQEQGVQQALAALCQRQDFISMLTEELRRADVLQ